MTKKNNEQALEVWLDADLMTEPLCVGRLYHQQGQVRFAYETSWIAHPAHFMLDPELSLDSDMNPSMDKAEHVLAIDEADPRPSLATLLQTAAFYRLTEDDAMQIITDVAKTVSTWPERARQMGIARSEMALMAGSFQSENV